MHPLGQTWRPSTFFLWGQMKSLVYETPVGSVEDLIARITAAVEYIWYIPHS
jgi:hypothetical protein